MAKAKTVTAPATGMAALRGNPAALAMAAANRAAKPAPANAHKYAAAHGNVPASVGGAMLTLTAAGMAQAVATQAALASGGKVTVSGLVCYAAKLAGATQSKPATGAAICLAMRASKQVAAAYANTRAGKYAPKGSLPCLAWCAGYVRGHVNKHGLLAKAA